MSDSHTLSDRSKVAVLAVIYFSTVLFNFKRGVSIIDKLIIFFPRLKLQKGFEGYIWKQIIHGERRYSQIFVKCINPFRYTLSWRQVFQPCCMSTPVAATGYTSGIQCAFSHLAGSGASTQ